MPDWNSVTLGLEKAVAQARSLGAAGAKLSCSRSESISAEFEAGRLKSAGTEERFGFTADVLVDGLRAQATAQHLDDLARTVEKAVGLARIGSVAHFRAWPAPQATSGVERWSEATLALSRESMIASCQSMADRLKAYDADLFVACSAGRSTSEGVLVTSGGVAQRWRKTSWSLGAFVQRTRDTDMLVVGNGRAWCDLNQYYDADAISGRVIEQLALAERSSEAPRGSVKCFLTPEALQMFLWPVWLGLNGRTVAKGESPLAGKVGQAILAPCFTIVDVPHRPFCPRGAEADADGIPTRRRELVEGGVLQGFLYDLDSAGLAGAEPTGNNGCRPYYPMVSPGRRSSAELLRSIDDGLYLTDSLIGFGQSNIVNGDFSCNVGLGYRIRNGEVVGRVKDTMIAGNVYQVLGGAVELAHDTDHEGTTPYAVVEGISSSAKGA